MTLPTLDDLVTEHQVSNEPGTEVVDLPDGLEMRAHEAKFWGDQPAHVPQLDMARLLGPTDYVWLTWLADVLRAAGCSVVEYPGWKTRGRPRSVGPFTPHGVLVHHDASAAGPSPALARFIASEGRPAEGIPAPLSQLWVCMGCHGKHPVGTWHVLAAGRANHAGPGRGWGKIPADAGTSLTLGIETDNTTGEPTPAAMRSSLVRGTAAIMRRLRSNPADWLAGHKEYAAGRKVDPDDIAMGAFRHDVAARMVQTGPVTVPPPAQNGSHTTIPGPKPSAGLVPFPGAGHFVVGHSCHHGFVRLLERWLIRLGHDHLGTDADARFTRVTREAVKDFQRSHAALRADADGIPGPLTWRTLQLEARSRGQ